MTFGWIAFLTDYGRTDWSVAACHGVMARIAPDVRVIDVSHEIGAQDVRHGAVVLEQAAPYLPTSVIVGVVDPGVGTSRRAVAMMAGEHVLIGPDNGLLMWAADACGGVKRAVELTAPAYRLDTAAVTFDGRDVFAPAAAHVAAGVPVDELGPELAVDDLVRLPSPAVDARPGVIEAEVHAVDHFGNVALAARAADLRRAGWQRGAELELTVRAHARSVRLGRTFADVAPGELVVLLDSSGHVALAVNHGSAAAVLGARAGDRLRLVSPHVSVG